MQGRHVNKAPRCIHQGRCLIHQRRDRRRNSNVRWRAVDRGRHRPVEFLEVRQLVMIRGIDGLRFVRTRHRTLGRHVGDGFALFQERAANCRVLAPVDRAVETEKAFQFAVDVDDVFTVDERDLSAEVLVNYRECRGKLDGQRAVLLVRRHHVPRHPVRFSMARQSSGLFLLRNRSESIDAHEMTEPLERIQLARLVFHEQLHHRAPDRADGQRELVVGKNPDGPAVECALDLARRSPHLRPAGANRPIGTSCSCRLARLLRESIAANLRPIPAASRTFLSGVREYSKRHL